MRLEGDDMSKQWGHGFHCGKMAIISDLYAELRFPDGFHKAVYLEAIGREILLL